MLLERGGCIVLVRTSARVGLYRGRWSGVSGYLEGQPLRPAMTEMQEKTRLDASDGVLVREAQPLHVGHSQEVRLDWENVHPR